MKTVPSLLAALVLTLVNACTTAPTEKASATAGPVSQHWSGDYPIAELGRLPPGQQNTGAGYLGSPAAFAAVWSAFKPGEAVPSVDFDRNIVVFVRNVVFYNSTSILKTELKDGVLEVLAMETRSAMPIENKAAMAMTVVPRQGVKFIQAGSTRLPVSGQ